MQSTSDSNSIPHENGRDRIWFFPHKWWQATKGMTKDEASQLMAQVEQDAENKDVEALKKYPFVYVGDPYKGSSAA
jgi:hypothetical protein